MIDVLAGPPVDHSQVTHVPWVFVDDLEAHLARAREMGATIVQDIESHGFTSYVALDIEDAAGALLKLGRPNRARGLRRIRPDPRSGDRVVGVVPT